MNVAVSGDVAFTRRSVDTKTAKDPRAPHQIINQKNLTSRNGILRRMNPGSPERIRMGVSIMRESREV